MASTRLQITRLQLSWSVSRGREAEGYNIARLDDCTEGKRYRCMGGGYDMVGTVFGEWLQHVYPTDLLGLQNRAYSKYVQGLGREELPGTDKLYGMALIIERGKKEGNWTTRVSLDGACGIDSMIRIAEALGFDVQRMYDKKGRTTGYLVSKETTE